MMRGAKEPRAQNYQGVSPMSYLFESPSLILTVGVFLIAALGYVFVNTRQKGVLIGLIAVVALTCIAMVIERYVKTPREQVEATLDALADELEANNIEGALKYLDPKAEETRKRARWAMARIRITKAKVTNLEIMVNETMSPPMAEVKFTGVIGVVHKNGGETIPSYPVKFTAKLRQHGDRWVVTEHTDSANDAR